MLLRNLNIILVIFPRTKTAWLPGISFVPEENHKQNLRDNESKSRRFVNYPLLKSQAAVLKEQYGLKRLCHKTQTRVGDSLSQTEKHRDVSVCSLTVHQSVRSNLLIKQYGYCHSCVMAVRPLKQRLNPKKLELCTDLEPNQSPGTH